MNQPPYLLYQSDAVNTALSEHDQARLYEYAAVILYKRKSKWRQEKVSTDKECVKTNCANTVLQIMSICTTKMKKRKEHVEKE